MDGFRRAREQVQALNAAERARTDADDAERARQGLVAQRSGGDDD